MAKLKQNIETSPDYQVYLEQKNFIDDKITFQEAAGPVFGDVNSIAYIISKYKEGDITKAQDEAFKLLMRKIPGRKLFYVTPAIRWLKN